jgi:hypothetical protein
VRSPNHGKVRRPRPPRVLFVTCYQEREGFVTVAVEQPGHDPIVFPARDQGHAVRLVDPLKQGMFDRQMG